jgi:fructuronate reductase
MRFVRGDRWPVDDPRAAELAALWRANDAGQVVDALFGAQGIFRNSWVAGSADRAILLALIGKPAAP